MRFSKAKTLLYSPLYPSTTKYWMNDWITEYVSRQIVRGLSEKTEDPGADATIVSSSVYPPYPKVSHGRILSLRQSMSKPIAATKTIMTCWLQILQNGGHCWELPDLHPVSHTVSEEVQLRWTGHWLRVSGLPRQPSWHSAALHCPVEGDSSSPCPKNVGSDLQLFGEKVSTWQGFLREGEYPSWGCGSQPNLLKTWFL